MAIKTKITQSKNIDSSFGVLTFGNIELSIRQVLLFLGLVIFLGGIFLTTQYGFNSFIITIIFFILLQLLAVTASSIPISLSLFLVMAGGYLAIFPYTFALLIFSNNLSNNFFVQFLYLVFEISCLAMPGLFIIFKSKKFTIYTLGNLDFILMNIYTALGYNFVVNALINNPYMFPGLRIIGNYYIFGPMIWSIYIGFFASLIINYKDSNKKFIVAIVSITILDLLISMLVTSKAITNYLNYLGLFTLNGFIFALIGFSILIIAIVWDRNIIKFTNELIKPKLNFKLNLIDQYYYTLLNRRLNYAFYRLYNSISNKQQSKLNLIVAILLDSVINYQDYTVSSLIAQGDHKNTVETAGPDFVNENGQLVVTNQFSLPKNIVTGSGLPDEYKLLKFISSGGMGIIYEVENTLNQQFYAAKLLHPKAFHEVRNYERFNLEAKSLSRLNHPNLVKIHNYGISANNIPYLIMDFVSGENLKDLIDRKKIINFDLFLAIFLQVCDALVYIHENGIIHRDLKPANIIISQNKDELVVKLVDFGIAKVLPQFKTESLDLTKSGDIVGSPMYMAPEQGLGHDIDNRTDIYSLGCVMYECLTGQPPFIGDNIMQTIFFHIHREPSPFNDLRPDVEWPIGLENAILKCLSKDMAKRYQYVSLLKQDLLKAKTNWEFQKNNNR